MPLGVWNPQPVIPPESVPAKPAAPTISVVIPTRGRPELVLRTLKAVLADPATTEAVVVIDGDDAETEASLANIARSDARVRLTHTSPTAGAPLGEQRVRDHGARIARSDVILALDDDIVAEPGMVSGHARWHAARDDLVVLGYMPVAPPPAGRRWSAATRLYSESYERACRAFDADPDSILAGLWGGNFSVRREHWAKADELEHVPVDFMHTDREFGLRLRRLCLHGRFDRSLRALHHDERDVARLVAAARGSAVANERLHRAHPDLVAPVERPPGGVTRWIVRALVAVTRSPRAWGLTIRLLTRLTGFAHARHLTSSEDALTRLASRLAYEREIARPMPGAAGRGPPRERCDR
jgi:hypothetical protein